MWHEIGSYACLAMQERRVCVTKAQPHKNFTPLLLTELCKNVRVEMLLQQLAGESLQQHTARGNKVICARGFRKVGQAGFF